jgi:hypothetical protein
MCREDTAVDVIPNICIYSRDELKVASITTVLCMHARLAYLMDLSKYSDIVAFLNLLPRFRLAMRIAHVASDASISNWS